MSSKITVAVDVDEEPAKRCLPRILACFVEKLAHFHNENYQTELTVAHFHSYEFHEVWGGSTQETAEKVDLFFRSTHFEDLPRVRDARETLEALKATGRFDFIVVTSRQHFLAERTKSWLDKHFPEVFSAVHFGNHYGDGVRKSKSQMCKENGATLLIDDSLKYARDCSSQGIKVILFDLDHTYPWNKAADLPALVKRVPGWAEVADALHSWAFPGHHSQH